VRTETLEERLTQKWASEAPQVNSQQPAQLAKPLVGQALPKLEHRVESDPEL